MARAPAATNGGGALVVAGAEGRQDRGSRNLGRGWSCQLAPPRSLEQRATGSRRGEGSGAAVAERASSGVLAPGLGLSRSRDEHKGKGTRRLSGRAGRRARCRRTSTVYLAGPARRPPSARGTRVQQEGVGILGGGGCE